MRTDDDELPFLELGHELIEEFLASCEDTCDAIDHTLAGLGLHAGSDQIHRLFRDMHSFKGNCRMVFLDAYVGVLHALEEIVEDLRDGRLNYQPLIGEFLGYGVHAVYDQIHSLVHQGHLDHQALHDLRLWIEHADQHRAASPEQRFALPHTPPPPPPEAVILALPSDLDLMLSLGQKLDGLSIYRRGRLELMMELAHLLNTALGSPCHEEQLMAAVCLHDIGMAFVPHGIFNKEAELSRDEQRLMQGHVEVGYQLLRRMGNWDEAAFMVLHHHERYDGRGYPHKLQATDIPAGSRILALVDTYSSITSERADRYSRKSLFSAITEINAHRASQFDPQMIDSFNEVIRQQIARQRIGEAATAAR